MGEVRVPAYALYGAQTQRAVENFPISGDALEPAQIVALARIKKAAALANERARHARRRDRRRDRREPPTRSSRASTTAVPDRRVPDRQRHVVEHEHERGARHARLAQPRPAGAPERPRQRVAVLERRLPDLGAHRRHRRAHRRPDPRARPPRRRPRGEGRGVGGRRQVGPHPPHGRHPRHPRPGVRRLRPPDAPRHRARAVGTPPRRRGAARRHGRRHRHQHARRLPAEGHRAPRSRHRAADHRGRRTTSRRRPTATASSRHPAPCAPSPCRSRRSTTTCGGWAPAPTPGSASCTSPTSSPARRSCRARSTRSIPEAVLMVCARVIGNDATIAWAGASGSFELNVAIPVMGTALLESIRLLSNALAPARRQDHRRPRGRTSSAPARLAGHVARRSSRRSTSSSATRRPRRSPSTRSPRASPCARR